MKIHMIEKNVQALGPFQRYALWLQGCPFNCEGCIAPDARDVEGGKDVPVQVLVQDILMQDVEGVTVSGGEPFFQAEELFKLIKSIKNKSDKGVIIFTGYEYERLNKDSNPSIQGILNHADVLIDGEYIKAYDDGLSMRGSSNQRAIMLSNRYKQFFNESFGHRPRKTEIFVEKDVVKVVGIPDSESKKLIDSLAKRKIKH